MNSPGRNGEPPSGADGSHDDRFASGDDNGGAGLPEVVVPDDISELDAEVQEYRREVRRAKRRARWSAVLVGPFRWVWRGVRRFLRLFRFLYPR